MFDSGGQVSLAQLPVRERLTADRTYYVRADGSDSNSGLANTSDGAFLTIQKALDTVYRSMDLHGFKAIIQVADGIYSQPLIAMGRAVGARDVLAQPIQIIGNEATPASVIINPSTSFAVQSWNHAHILLAGFTITNATGIGLMASNYGMIEHRNCVFGATSGEKIIAFYHSLIKAVGPTTVTGNSLSFVHATKRSIIDFSGLTLTFADAPVFSQYLWGVNDSSVNLDGATIVGSATGGISVHDNGIINATSVTGTWTGGQAAQVTDGGIIAIADLMVSRTWFVRNDGNDGNDGLANSAARAFKTIQGAINTLAKLNFNPIAWNAALSTGITIQLAPGTYSETITLSDLQFAGCTIVGDETKPAKVIVNGVIDGFSASGTSTKWFIRGMKITAAAGNAVRAEQGAQISFRRIDFGKCSSAHLLADRGGRLRAEGNYSISGDAPEHMRGYMGGQIDISGVMITIIGTPAFSSAFASAEFGTLVRVASATFNGTAMGVRHRVTANSVIDAGGAGKKFLPGNAAGFTASGGQFV